MSAATRRARSGSGAFARGIAAAILAFGLVLLATACSSTAEQSPGAAPTSTGLTTGLHERSDGTVDAVGVLEYRDLEGGFWAVVDTASGSDTEFTIVAVIANGDDFSTETEALEGSRVIVEGTLLEGVSTRMSGPEVEATSITSVEATGAAQ